MAMGRPKKAPEGKPEKEKKSAVLPNMKIEPTIKNALEDLADREDISLSAYVYRVIKQHVRRRYHPE